MRFRLRGASYIAVLVASASAARAQEADLARSATPANSALTAVADGSFLPLTLSPRVGSTQVFAFGSGGYDSLRASPLVDAAAEARIWGPIAVRAQTTYSADTRRMRPSLGGRAQLLRQEKHGVDGALTVFFKTEGFTETEGEIETFASFGRRFEQLSVMADLVYGQDPEGNERDGEIRAAAFHQHRWLADGIDSRARFALGAQHGRAATTEPVFDFQAGPVATAAAGPAAIFAEIGPSAFQMDHSPTHVGVAALVGLGAAY